MTHVRFDLNSAAALATTALVVAVAEPQSTEGPCQRLKTIIDAFGTSGRVGFFSPHYLGGLSWMDYFIYGSRTSLLASATTAPPLTQEVGELVIQ